MTSTTQDEDLTSRKERIVDLDGAEEVGRLTVHGVKCIDTRLLQCSLASRQLDAEVSVMPRQHRPETSYRLLHANTRAVEGPLDSHAAGTGAIART